MLPRDHEQLKCGGSLNEEQRRRDKSGLSMGRDVRLLSLLILLSGVCGAAENESVSNDAVLPKLQVMLSKHCTDCHSDDSREGDVRLDNLLELKGGGRVELLARIEEQVYLGQMPPEDNSESGRLERDDLLGLVTSAFNSLGTVSGFREKLKTPSYGNHVSHQKLFSGEVTAKSFSPRRLWRTSPHVFENVKSQYGGELRSLRQPFIVDDKQGIKEYASLLFADSAVVNVLLTNAGASADRLIATQTVFKKIAESGQEVTDGALQDAIEQHFNRVVYRPSSDAELQRYIDLFRKSAEDAGNLEALRVVLMAIMLHHESVYRVELGLGEVEPDGRRMLAPAELAFAIAFAITDKRPDQDLLQAARSGRLATRHDVRSQVRRILDDHTIDKPRLLRFFQEFFGYAHAHKIFKDAKRSGGFSYYGENYPEMYERDADFFVMNILEDDKDVFRKLLTSDEYYILNRQTFRNTVYDFYLKNQAALDKGDFPEKKQQELLTRLDLRDWSELNTKYHLHKFNRGFNGSVQAIRQIVKEIKEWKNTTNDEILLHSMQPLYRKYPMVYDLSDEEQDFLLPQPYKRPNRAGILTHPAWLIAHSLNDSTDPIRRGKWIRERLLAGSVPDLPITVDATVPEDHNKTLRERLAITEQDECWRCHKKMNPLGYVFEIYDDFGRFRTEENLDKLPKVKGQFPRKPIDAKTRLVATGDDFLNSEYENALELIDKLADSDLVRQSIIRHVFRYFMGRNEMLSDSQTLMAADQAYLESGGSFNSLLISLLTSDSFLYRK